MFEGAGHKWNGSRRNDVEETINDEECAETLDGWVEKKSSGKLLASYAWSSFLPAIRPIVCCWLLSFYFIFVGFSENCYLFEAQGCIGVTSS